MTPNRCPSAAKCGSIRAVRALCTLLAILLSTLSACEGELDERRFARRAERAYLEVHPGWTIVRRQGGETLFVRGDQQDKLRVGELYRAYKESGRGASVFFEDWTSTRRRLTAARRRSLSQAASDVIPIIKGGAWVRAQDLGAVGSNRTRSMIRPWRRPIAEDVFVILGIPEDRIGYRFVSIDEVETSTRSADDWLARSINNVVANIEELDGKPIYAADNEDKLIVLRFPDIDGVSATILSADFRRRMVERFGLEELGAAVPVRNTLIVFDPQDFSMLKPVRARAHQLYDNENHPGFRGLLRLTVDGVSVLESPVAPPPQTEQRP